MLCVLNLDNIKYINYINYTDEIFPEILFIVLIVVHLFCVKFCRKNNKSTLNIYIMSVFLRTSVDEV